MWNGKEENTATPADATDVRTIEGRCPRWCVGHEWADVGHVDEFVVHCGPVRIVGTREVQLRQVVFVNDGKEDAVYVRIDDHFSLPAEAAREAMELAAVLTESAAVAG